MDNNNKKTPENEAAHKASLFTQVYRVTVDVPDVLIPKLLQAICPTRSSTLRISLPLSSTGVRAAPVLRIAAARSGHCGL